MAYNLKIKSFYLPIVLRSNYKQLERFASSAAQQAMHERNCERALEFIATAFDAQKRQLSVVDEESERPISSPNREFLRYASIFGRGDLIDHAVAMEDAALKRLRAGALAPDSDIEGVEFGTYDAAGNETVHPAAMRRAHYESALPGWIETHERRRQQAVDHKSDIDTYRAIRRLAAKSPGIPRTDLAKKLDLSNKTISHLVDQLAATEFLVTGKTGSRVAVWPAGHKSAPRGEQQRTPEWSFGQDPSFTLPGMEAPPTEFVDPERSLNETQELISLLETAADDSSTVTGSAPTPMDFLDGMVGLATHPEGHIAYLDEYHLSLAFWGHIDRETVYRILRGHLANSHVPAKDRRKWLNAAPRPTHVERLGHQAIAYDGTGHNLWLLREVPSPTEKSVPVTAVTAPVTMTAEEAAGHGGIIWLPQNQTRAK